MNTPTRIEVLLSVQRGLLGEVSPQLRAVGVAEEAGRWKLIFIFDGSIGATDRDSATTVMAEVMADFDPGMITDELISLDAPAALPTVDAWAYVRREN